MTYPLRNCYFTIGPKSVFQTMGIPMGPAPFITNQFLYFSETKWINEIKNNDLIKARGLRQIFRFIDDLNSINGVQEFESNARETISKI